MKWDSKQKFKNYIEKRTVYDEIVLSILREYENELSLSQSPSILEGSVDIL